MDPVCETHHPQRLDRAFLPVLDGGSTVQQRELDILDRRGPRKKVESLEDEPQLAVPDVRQLVPCQPADIDPVEYVCPLRRFVQASQDVHERRLPRSGCAHDRDEFPSPDLQGHAAECVDLDFPQHVGFHEVIDLYEASIARGRGGGGRLIPADHRIPPGPPGLC